MHLLNSGGFCFTISEEGKCFPPFDLNDKAQKTFLCHRRSRTTNKNWGEGLRQVVDSNKKHCHAKVTLRHEFNPPLI